MPDPVSTTESPPVSTTEAPITTTTTTPSCTGTCIYAWSSFENDWYIFYAGCSGEPCVCPGPPAYPGEYHDQTVELDCVSSTTTTTTTAAPCEGICQYQWSDALNAWFIEFSGCVGEGCGCPPPPETPGSVNGETWGGYCIPGGTTTTTTTTSTTTTTTTSPPATTTTTTTTTTTSTTTTTTSTTTSTTTTAEPCTGSCTWRWSDAGQTWLKYGTGNCSTGCSCVPPSSPGTVDGEHQSVSCARLTCQACCGSVACCPAYPVQTDCCDNTVPSILTVTIDTDPDCACGATTFEFEYSPTGFTGLGPGWYIRRPGDDMEYIPAPLIPWVRNGSCASVTDLCDATNTSNPNPENTYIGAFLRCVNVGSNNYNFQLTFSYGRLMRREPVPGIFICQIEAITTFIYDLDPICSPFYGFVNNVALSLDPLVNESGCDNPYGYVTVTISE